MTLLNTPMPAEKALKIIRSMLKSNKHAVIDVVIDQEATQRERTKHYTRSYDIENEIWDKQGTYTLIKVHSDYPTYSIGDKVLIISTGEIGEVGQSDGSYIHLNEENRWYRKYHWSQLAKLPNDL